VQVAKWKAVFPGRTQSISAMHHFVYSPCILISCLRILTASQRGTLQMAEIEAIEATEVKPNQAEAIVPAIWPKTYERFHLVLLSVVAVLVYANTLWNGFTLDDDLYISLNSQVTHASLRTLFSPHTFSAVFRPVTFATFALNWALGGAHPFGFHLVN